MKESLFALAVAKMRHLPRESIQAMKNSKGKIRIKLIPKLHEATTSKRSAAIHILRMCPFSDYFGEDEYSLKLKLTKKLAPNREL